MGALAEFDDATSRARGAAEQAAKSPALERVARLGLAVRGVLYLLVAALALRVATGHDERADKEGALQAVLRQPLGKLGLAVLAAGFAGYALWRFTEAVTGPPDETDRRKAALKRLGYAARGLLYAFFCASAVRLIIWSNRNDPSENVPDWTGRVLEWPGGRLLVMGVGAAIVGGGLYVGWRGLAKKFRKRLDTHQMSRAERWWTVRLGTIGMAARMVVAVLIGMLLIFAAAHHDPGEAVGIDGALKRLAATSMGPGLLTAVAAGLAAYGVYSLAEARYRRVRHRTA